jgi:transposase
MRFYKGQHAFYCGVDLHAKTMHICLVNQAGEVLVHRNLPTDPERFLNTISPYRAHDVVVGVECMFTWYWLADLSAQHGIAFVLGHALYMKAIHGGKAKNDKIDSEKIAMLLRADPMPGDRPPHDARFPESGISMRILRQWSGANCELPAQVGSARATDECDGGSD